jgi:hypothetical protein
MSIHVPQIERGNVVPGAVLLSPDDRGANETFLGHIDALSGRHKVYIKIASGKQLINELIATTVGRALNLPIPKGYLLSVRPIDLPDSKLLQQHGAEALAFGSRALNHPSLLRRFKSKPEGAVAWAQTNFKKWDEALIFDDWIANADRHPGNLLVGTADQVWLIDHGHSFTGPEWQASQLLSANDFGNQLANLFIPNLTLPQRVALRDKSGVMSHLCSAVDIGQVMSGSFADHLLGPSDMDAVSNFLRDRIPSIVDIISRRVGIPRLGG